MIFLSLLLPVAFIAAVGEHDLLGVLKVLPDLFAAAQSNSIVCTTGQCLMGVANITRASASTSLHTSTNLVL